MDPLTDISEGSRGDHVLSHYDPNAGAKRQKFRILEKTSNLHEPYRARTREKRTSTRSDITLGLVLQGLPAIKRGIDPDMFRLIRA